MTQTTSELGTALIVGVGEGLGASLCRRFAAAGHPIAMAARNIKKLTPLVDEIQNAGGTVMAFNVDATQEEDVVHLFASAEANIGQVEIAIFNVGALRYEASILDMPTKEFQNAWHTSCLGGMFVGREAARLMVPRGRGTIQFTGGIPSRRAEAKQGAFAVGKFGLRAIAQSMARELAPKGIHVSHFVIGGMINNQRMRKLEPEKAIEEDGLVSTEALADLYYHIHQQPKSSWTFEVDL
ncbi:MAG: SDR family NAD(P)-dependent oxidoreductase, partial [Pseudomonadota bacterium]|nr:SDR family NAD(P)-dependent oxidoreductase [Pseudomonadota bacterium]